MWQIRGAPQSSRATTDVQGEKKLLWLTAHLFQHASMTSHIVHCILFLDICLDGEDGACLQKKRIIVQGRRSSLVQCARS